MKMGPPSLTIVTTVFQRANLLPGLYWDLTCQLDDDWEWIVIEDGEHPRVHKMLDHLKQRVPETNHNVTLVPNYVPQGAIGMHGNPLRRRGLQLARGKYIAWVSHDSRLAPTFVGLHLQNFAAAKRPAISLVNVDYFVDEFLYMGKTPRGWNSLEKLQMADLDLLNIAVPVDAARAVDMFGPKEDQNRFSWYGGFDRLRHLYPVIHANHTAAARF